MKVEQWEIRASGFTLFWLILSGILHLTFKVFGDITFDTGILIFIYCILPPCVVSATLWHFHEEKQKDLAVKTAANAINAVEQINLMKDMVTPQNCPHIDVRVLTAQPVTLRPKTGECKHCGSKVKTAWILDVKK